MTPILGGLRLRRQSSTFVLRNIYSSSQSLVALSHSVVFFSSYLPFALRLVSPSVIFKTRFALTESVYFNVCFHSVLFVYLVPLDLLQWYL